MKRSILLIPLLAGLMQAGGLAQTPRAGGVRWANLSMEERGKLRIAHQQAMRDPALRAARERFRAARREFREKLRQGLIKADPMVQPILEKMKKSPGERD